MAGCLPSSRILLTRNSTVLGEFNNYREVSFYLGATIDDKGVIHCCGESTLHSFILKQNSDRNSFTKEEALSRWSKDSMKRYISRHGYKTYRFID